MDQLPAHPEMETFRPVTVLTTSNLHEAHLVKSVLEGNTISAILLDGGLASLNLFLTNAIGGIKLAVSESDLNEANEILKVYRSKEGVHPSSGVISPFS